MSIVKLYDQYLTDIANAIRLKTGSNSTITPANMASYVPNSYSAGDEGKVVSNGALVAQTARSSQITQNGTYDTTENNSVIVNIQGGGGGGAEIQRRDYAKFRGVSGGVQLPFNLDENTGIEVEFMFENNSPIDTNAIGTWDTAIYGNITWIRLLNEGNYLYIGNGTVSGQFNVSLTYGQKHTIKTNVNNQIYYDDVAVNTYIPTNPGRNVPLVIGENYMTTPRNYFTGKIYSYKLYDRSTGTQIANIYPAIMLIEYESFVHELPILYDSISKDFYLGQNIFDCYNEE